MLQQYRVELSPVVAAVRCGAVACRGRVAMWREYFRSSIAMWADPVFAAAQCGAFVNRRSSVWWCRGREERPLCKCIQ